MADSEQLLKKETENSVNRRPSTVNQISYLGRFQCLADKCEDTCCKGWGMQVDAERLKLYKEKAPELLEVVTTGETAHVMRRDEKTGYCVKFEDGLCGIQKKLGSDYLPDSCNFYPRITRQFGGELYMAGSISCPEIARLAIYGDAGFDFTSVELERTPLMIKNYLEGSGLDKDSSVALMQKFIHLADDEVTPERIMSRIVSIAHSLDRFPAKDWLGAFDAFYPAVDERLAPAKSAPTDPYNLLNVLSGLAANTRKPIMGRLSEIISSVEQGLGVRVNWEKKTVERAREESYMRLSERYYREISPLTVLPLKNWIKATLAASAFPFGGLGKNAAERAIIIAVRFATLKLAIMANMQQMLQKPQETMIFLIQGLARFLDHLADPQLSMDCYREVGWTDEGKLRGLLGDGLS